MIEDEKRMVAKWMGWKVEPLATLFRPWWNPQSSREPWPELWGNMDEETRQQYMNILHQMIQPVVATAWEFHTMSFEVCWRALIKVLEDK